MTARCFADTNIFVYAGSKAPDDSGKREVARKIIVSEDIGLSVQVLQEFIAVTLGKKRLGITEEETRETLTVLMEFPLVPTTGKLVQTAFDYRSRFQISYWDAAIIAAAHTLSAQIIYSEDLNHGQNYDGVRVINPFLTLRE